MKFNFDCRKCARTIEAEWSWIGKTITCTSCGTSILVPAPMETATRESKKVGPSLDDELKFRCQECGRRYTTRGELAGKKIRCGGCGAQVRIPVPDAVPRSGDVGTTPALPSSDKSQKSPKVVKEEAARLTKIEKFSPPKVDDSDTDSDSDFEPDTEFHIDQDFDTEAETTPQTTQKATSPTLRTLDDNGFPAKAAMAGDRVERAADGDTVFAELPAVPAAVASRSKGILHRILDIFVGSPPEKMDSIEQQLSDQARAKIKDQRDRERTVARMLENTGLGGGVIMSDAVNILIATVVSILVISVICWRYSNQSFVIGGLLAFCGLIVYFNATGHFARIAAAEGTNQSLACRFVPFYKWYYLITRWHEMKAHFVFIIVGMMVFWHGVLILAVSPSPLNVSNDEKAATDRADK